MGNSENLAGVRTAYDTVAEAYSEALPDTSFEARLDMAMINDFCARLRAAPGRKVIDAGCGAGRLSVRLAEAGLDVTGVDLSPGMVRVAQRSHPREDPAPTRRGPQARQRANLEKEQSGLAYRHYIDASGTNAVRPAR
jgi:ubiquinone/menaquinone biosynthesis C-methylase UbiE